MMASQGEVVGVLERIVVSGQAHTWHVMAVITMCLEHMCLS